MLIDNIAGAECRACPSTVLPHPAQVCISSVVTLPRGDGIRTVDRFACVPAGACRVFDWQRRLPRLVSSIVGVIVSAVPVQAHIQNFARLEFNPKQLVMERVRRNWTQRELASKAGVHRSQVAHWELGQAEPRLASVQRLAHALGVEPTTLFKNE